LFSFSYNLNQQIFVENSAVAGKPTNTVRQKKERKKERKKKKKMMQGKNNLLID